MASTRAADRRIGARRGLHHSRDVGPGTHTGLRAQKAASSGEGGGLRDALRPTGTEAASTGDAAGAAARSSGAAEVRPHSARHLGGSPSPRGTVAPWLRRGRRHRSQDPPPAGSGDEEKGGGRDGEEEEGGAGEGGPGVREEGPVVGAAPRRHECEVVQAQDEEEEEEEKSDFLGPFHFLSGSRLVLRVLVRIGGSTYTLVRVLPALPHGPVCSADHGVSSVAALVVDVPVVVGRAGSQVLPWRRPLRSHSCSSLRNL